MKLQAPKISRSTKQVSPELLVIMQRLACGLSPWPLFLYGPSGTGKTCGSLLFSDIVIGSMYYSIDDVIRAEMLSDYSDDSRIEKAQVWRNIKYSSLLIIDDIGERDKIGDLYTSVLKRILDLREVEQYGRAIYISNQSPAELGKLMADRIMSRMMRGTKYLLDGSDRRAEQGGGQ